MLQASPFLANRTEATALLIAAVRSSSLDELAKILKDPFVDVNGRHFDGLNALLLAVHNNNLAMTSLLLSHPGIQINYEIRLENVLLNVGEHLKLKFSPLVTPLSLALACKHDQVAMSLLAHGANPGSGHALVTAVCSENLALLQCMLTALMKKAKRPPQTELLEAISEAVRLRFTEAVDVFVDVLCKWQQTAPDYTDVLWETLITSLYEGLSADQQDQHTERYCDYFGTGALFFLFLHGQTDAAQRVLAASAVDPEHKDEVLNSCIQGASACSDPKVLLAILEYFQMDSGQLSTVLEVMACAEMPESRSWTKLHAVLKRIEHFCVEPTIDQQVLVSVIVMGLAQDASDDEHQTVLDNCRLLCKYIKLDSQGERPSSSSLTMALAEVNKLDLLRGLHEIGIESDLLDYQTEEGTTALHIATTNGHAQFVKYLLETGANATLQDKSEFTPFLTACWFGKEECARLLDEHLKSTNESHQPNSDGVTPYLAACHGNLAATIREWRPSPDWAKISDRHGNGSLHFACMSHSLSVVHLLIDELKLFEASQLLTLLNEDGKSPFQLAVDAEKSGFLCELFKSYAAAFVEVEVFRMSPDVSRLDAPICAICREEGQIDDQLARLSCYHCFHVNCLAEWIEIDRHCPLCKRPFILLK